MAYPVAAATEVGECFLLLLFSEEVPILTERVVLGRAKGGVVVLRAVGAFVDTRYVFFSELRTSRH